MQYKWKVSEPPSGRYRSLSNRQWPEAHYSDDSPCAWVTCEDEYVPRKVKAGDHKPLVLYVADYSITPTVAEPCPWKHRRVTGTCSTLAEAKQKLARLFESMPQLQPKV